MLRAGTAINRHTSDPGNLPEVDSHQGAASFAVSKAVSATGSPARSLEWRVAVSLGPEELIFIVAVAEITVP
jgi:hypothetical protein